MSLARLVMLAIVPCVAILVAAGQPPKMPAGKEHTLKNRNVRWGMPSAARVDVDNKDEYLIERPQYVISYSDKKKIPNWVSWNLVRADVGRTARGAFEEDPDLPRGFQRVQFQTYSGSGFDRGHMCPSKDRSDTEINNDKVFLMTNIIPQSPACNQKGWERLESYCRDLAFKGDELDIVCGPHGIGGMSEGNQKKLTIGRNPPFVTVPASVWKVILVLPNRAAMPNKNTRAIAVWMPNDGTVTDDWPKYRVSIHEIEKKTGFHFFRLIPDDIAKVLKEKADDVKVVVPPRK